MLSENIREGRRAKGLSQEELAAALNVVRQTVSKWEQGLSAPDAEMLISLSETLEMPVSVLLGERPPEAGADDLKAMAERLEAMDRQLARRKAVRKKAVRWLCIGLCGAVLAAFAALVVWNQPYLRWDYSDPETAVMGTFFHGVEWLFVRLAPLLLLGGLAGVWLTRKKS